MTTILDDALDLATADLDAATAELEALLPTLPAAIAANGRELADVRAALKVLNEREETLKKAIRAYLEGANLDAATDGTVSVFRSQHDRKGVDRKKLEALYPNVLKDVGTTTPIVQIRSEVKG